MAPGGLVDGESAACGPVCPKCKEAITQETLAATTQARKKYSLGLDSECSECVKNYKSLTRRWKTSKKLQIWFASLCDEQKVDWYLKQKEKSSKLTTAEKRAERMKLRVTTRTEFKRGKKNSNRMQLTADSPAPTIEVRIVLAMRFD